MESEGDFERGGAAVGRSLTGTVLWFKNEKGFGRITGDDGYVYFVHHAAILGEGYKLLEAGQRVSFEWRGFRVAHGRRSADNVRLLLMAHTLLAIPVAELDPLLRSLRLRFEPGWEPPDPQHVAAHVTVLSPFVPIGECDATLEERLAGLFDRIAPFRYRLARVGTFAGDVVYLAPEPAEPFRALTREAMAAFPGYEPYGGRFAGLVPHMTVGPILSPEIEAELSAAALGAVPVEIVATEARLIHSWEHGFDTLTTFPLGG